LYSCLCLFVLGFSNFWSPSLLPFVFLAFGEGTTLLFLELPFLMSCCPTGKRFDNFVKFFASPILRSILYGGFATLMWLSILIETSSLLACAITMTFAFCFYFYASVKNEIMTRSVLDPTTIVGQPIQGSGRV